MLSCCCSNSTCSWEHIRSRSRSETANGDVNDLVEEADQSEIVADLTRMDIALLTEQYNLTKEKQKRQTLVVLFRQGRHRFTRVVRELGTHPTGVAFSRTLTCLSDIEKVLGDSISIHPVELSTSNSSSGSRKFSAPAILSRQLSFGGQRPPLLSSCPHHHYPFPQRKGPKKSEAARRLGMYSSF
uniref:Uncharacterized protein n=1 Tax=Oncorhynchus kisutch TaxID=8019 RepID=A0A8C7LEZ3_ONCKI